MLAPERLDSLSPDDPEAKGSRRDLARINRIMGNAGVTARLLGKPTPNRILEIGAGDGSFLLHVIKKFEMPTELSRATLLDRQNLMSHEDRAQYGRLGWGIETVTEDVFDYLADPHTGPFPAITANLFLHHFEDDRLAELLGLVARKTDRFVAVEPRRSPAALTGTKFLGLLGCNSVTRHDARVSVHAGFADRELSKLWPVREGWGLKERPAGAFGHAFRAVRTASLHE